MAAPAGVTAHGWGWRYAGRRLPAVSEVTFTIEPGERVLLLGASGAGKSTLLAGLAGVLGDADEGERTGSLLVDGAVPESRRGAIGLVLQDPDAGVVLSKVGDDVAFGCENLGVPAEQIPGRVAGALDAVGLDVPLDRPTKALSGDRSSGSRWPACWPCNRDCCCWTSRPRTSIRTVSARCARASAACWKTPGRRSSSSSTARRSGRICSPG
ncbi:hypothetical protein GCM10025863_28770 [Microbacterium suwonense]|uniref:ABC transporter domain-containing protein n=1 Tax=Microbacterium suwonense TaxID=683047 RepID=A0ABM8FX00_9MICO|nr:hypothetical protein GCM10025863_28770 [Microbacterium suwonense]